MASQRQALVLSCEVPGEEPLPGASYNAEKLSKFFRRANVPTGCVYGRKLTLDRAKEDINDFFSTHCDVHVLYGIFHGCQGSWKLSDGNALGLGDILEQWDLAKQLGTAQNLLIVSDSCESGQMVSEAKLLGRGDIAVQASCSGSNNSLDTKGETFTEYLLWNLQGRSTANKRGGDMLLHIERALLEFCPSYYCPARSNYRGWVFVNEDGADPSSSQSVSLASDTSDTTSQRSGPEEAFGLKSPPPEPQPEDAEDLAAPEPEDLAVPDVRTIWGFSTPPRAALVLFFEAPSASNLVKFFREANWPVQFSSGRKLTLDRAKEDIKGFFSNARDLHVLYGIFHGHAGAGCWQLSEGEMLGLDDILEQWDLAKQLGTAQNLLIVSDSCESGQMVNEAKLLGRGDIAVQASCAGSNNSLDTKGETFTEYLLWNLQGRSTANKRGADMLLLIEPALLTLEPHYYCSDRSRYTGWIFFNEDGADWSYWQSLSLRSDTTEGTFSQRSYSPGLEDALSPTSDPPRQEDSTLSPISNLLEKEDALSLTSELSPTLASSPISDLPGLEEIGSPRSLLAWEEWVHARWCTHPPACESCVFFR